MQVSLLIFFHLDKLELVGSDTIRYLLQKLKMFEGRPFAITGQSLTDRCPEFL